MRISADTMRPGSPLVEECYRRSIRLLRKNSHAGGVIACAKSKKAVDRGYAAVFGRDAAICALGMVASGDRELLRHARVSLLTLANHQAGNGQIPKYVKPASREVDFWYSGCIDATLWWLVAVDFYDRSLPGEGLREKLAQNIGSALGWLFCQEHQGMYLLQQNEASDWADIMPRSGFVLYSNALWYHVKKRYGIATAGKTRDFFKIIFFPFDKPAPDHKRARVLTDYITSRAKRRDFYLSFVNFSFWGEEVDVLGNILACILGLSFPEKANAVVDGLIRLRVNRPFPVRVVHAPIRELSRFWRPYMERHSQNFPYQYHNGGIWPFAGGFWVMLLAQLGREELAGKELERLAESLAENNWGFNEWLHGRTGKPMGMTGQSWNAALFVLAYRALRGLDHKL
ncbi:MAG TPA: glycoside hydrolase 100 family protein [Nitrospirota bacterium]|nr:glycoside hydrolase 100 family protein [Nitrospirota bacterium]